MTYANAHLLLRAHGTFGNVAGNEEWSVGLRCAIVGADVPMDTGGLQTFVEAAHAAFRTFHTASLVLASTSCYFTHATVARIGTDGKYDPAVQDTTTSTGQPLVGVGTLTQPFTAALVVSLRTNRPRGYASNGRLYWPACAMTMNGGTGRAHDTATAGRATAAAALIQDINTAATAYATNMRVAVMSSVGTGVTALVTSVRVDDRVDNIERRENANPPAYASAPI